MHGSVWMMNNETKSHFIFYCILWIGVILRRFVVVALELARELDQQKILAFIYKLGRCYARRGLQWRWRWRSAEKIANSLSLLSLIGSEKKIICTFLDTRINTRIDINNKQKSERHDRQLQTARYLCIRKEMCLRTKVKRPGLLSKWPFFLTWIMGNLCQATIEK